jgi:hypothetical protein
MTVRVVKTIGGWVVEVNGLEELHPPTGLGQAKRRARQKASPGEEIVVERNPFQFDP